MERNNDFHKDLKEFMDRYVHLVYDYSNKFPKDELYGVTSQFRRSALSVILNYIEGYSRNRKAVLKNFLEISFGSLKESKYLCYFSYKRNYLTKLTYDELDDLNNKIGAMLWGIIKKI